ncbi:hypothetical protein BKA67DRAFT_564394 [Truncatella angustata]|uniref:Uncharacterized protein n=1 Tax=Truncatella angustata TaxID=152316 RepID=A0A9P8ULC8_9PEZI|nr:uncharacterized protein BKA67DRAFT_564394 [Truncatella angustata]KAH6654196.1 hypothetical protein BKA67DRAFT_564394 [Truncatella angustata]
MGDQLVAPFRQLHLNHEIFGRGAPNFGLERFLENKMVHRTKGYSPFGGGGLTFCRGGLLAQRDINLFVAVTLRKFDMELVPRRSGAKMPKIDKDTPSAAVMGPDEDILLRLLPRVHTQVSR